MMEMLPTHTDKTLLGELGQRIARLRVQSRMTQAELAFEAGISKSTLERLEAGKSIQVAGLLRVLRVLGLIGHLDRLVPATVDGPLALLDGSRPVRKRSPRKKKPDAETGPWRWGDQ